MYGHYYHSISDLYILGIILIIFGIANLLGHGAHPGHTRAITMSSATEGATGSSASYQAYC